jgi:prepilin signal peptidase PulO-like enzyme (type II secretory pathway)
VNVLNRACPSCSRRTISVLKLVVWRVRCAHCGAQVGTHPAWRLPILSVEMMVWLLALNWLQRDYGRTGVVLSFMVWLAVDLVADWYTPLVARRR